MANYVGVPSIYPKLLEIRKSTTAEFRPNKHWNPDMKLRYYQVIGALHMMLLERMVLGDATGIGKTAQSLAAYSFLLEKDPTLKLLVVCTKSALFQWAEEIDKFTIGVSRRVITTEYQGLTGYNARKLQYQLYQTHNEHVMIMNYAPILEEYEAIKEALGSNFMIIFDECFEYHTPITLEDGSTELIGKIVSKKLPVKVLSFNKLTGKIEPKRVVGYYRSPKTSWYKIKGRRTNSAICSPNHKFYTPSGEREVKDLLPGDIVYGYCLSLSEIQKQMVLGTLLGDGSLNYKRYASGKDVGVLFMQSTKRAGYLNFKKQIMSSHLGGYREEMGGWNKVPMGRQYVNSSPSLTEFLQSLNFIERGKRTVSLETLNKLSPMGIAIWFCDDGCRSKNTVSLNTQCFSKEENQIIIDYFDSAWGIKFHLAYDKKKKLYWIYSCAKDKAKFLKMISPYVPKSMAYKTDLPCDGFWSTYEAAPDKLERFEDVIEICRPHKFSKGTFDAYRYNIEVEDNHNYFAGGMLVSNCTAFKNRKSKTHVSCGFLSQGARRVYGLSATIIKNGLEEVYGIYDIVVPGLFGKITQFKDKFCQQKMMKLMINGKMRYIPKITGYKNLEEFRTRLDPYFLIRRKEDVAKELPKLISKKIILDMFPEQKELYKQALSGIIYEEKVKQDFYQISDQIRLGAADEKTAAKYKILKEKYDKFLTTEGKKRGKLAALTYCQMISNSPALVNQPGESSKDDEFIRLIKEELAGEKVIVFTRFKSGIPSLEVLCERNSLKYTKITGDCNDRERDEARIKFQTSKDCNIIFITTAGSMSLNLQAAGAMIFIDTPWSYGDLVQLIGRAQRIGSIQEHVLLIHLINRGSIDLRVMNRVTDKKDLSDEVLGDTAKGALDFTQYDDNAVDSLFSDIMEDAQALAA